MKYRDTYGNQNRTYWSRPARGARIEMPERYPAKQQFESRPARGARIEIDSVLKIANGGIVSRPARGARIEISHTGQYKHSFPRVAPRKGRED